MPIGKNYEAAQGIITATADRRIRSERAANCNATASSAACKKGLRKKHGRTATKARRPVTIAQSFHSMPVTSK